MKPDVHSRWLWRWRTALGLALLLGLPLFLPVGSPLWAQRRRDPLNPLEIDQLRDAMLDPDQRLKLYVKFSRDRMRRAGQERRRHRGTPDYAETRPGELRRAA